METDKKIADVKKLEEQLGAARAAALGHFLGAIEESLASLRAIGFKFEIVDKTDAPKKIGRPKKGAANGKTAEADTGN
jgi:hypothetical protein